MAYRPEIDGLRALAVLAVVLFHACGFPSGGFAGVDVFFVISGYVITRLLMREGEQGRFSIAAFYERRIRRIAPALVATILLTGAAAYFVLLPPDYEAFGESVVATALMVSNVHFLRGSGYFEAAAQAKPLLHTWSLSIEEQFYVLYPLAFAAAWRFARHRLVAIFAVAALLSFCASLWTVGVKPSVAFYLTPFRAWELLLGALTAVAPLRRIGGGCALAGLALIAASYLFLTEATPFPGIAALPATAGAALVLAGATDGTLAARLLSLRPLVFVGKISYSLYLVHWPLIVLTEYHQGAPLGPGQAAVVTALALGLAAASWVFIEQPFRRPKAAAPRRAVFGAAAAAIAVLSLAGHALAFADGLPGRLPEAVRAAYAAKDDVWAAGLKCWADTRGSRGPSPAEIRTGALCRYGPEGPLDQPLDYVVWGDSHAAAMAPAIIEAAGRAGARGGLIAAGNCPPLQGFDPVGIRSAVTRRCHELNAAALDYFRAYPPKLVFMTARWPRYAMGGEYGIEGMMFDPSQIKPAVPGEAAKLAAALDATLVALNGMGVRPVLVLGIPEPGYHVPYAYARAILRGETPAIAPSRATFEGRERQARAILEKAAAVRGATLVDPTPELCDARTCGVEAGGALLFSDHSHLSLTGAKRLSPLYDPAFQQLRHE